MVCNAYRWSVGKVCHCTCVIRNALTHMLIHTIPIYYVFRIMCSTVYIQLSWKGVQYCTYCIHHTANPACAYTTCEVVNKDVRWPPRYVYAYSIFCVFCNNTRTIFTLERCIHTCKYVKHVCDWPRTHLVRQLILYRVIYVRVAFRMCLSMV